MELAEGSWIHRFAANYGSPAVVRVVLLALLLPASSAIAASRDSRDSRERIARASCLAGDVTKGMTILSQLFVETEDATYIYNQGRCFEQNARYEDAITRFQEYLRVVPRSAVQYRAEAKKHIADCQELLASKPTPSTTAPAAFPAVPVVPTPNQAPNTTAVAPLTRDTATPASASRPGESAIERAAHLGTGSSSGVRIASIVTVAVGGAALAAGLILNLKANNMVSDSQKLNGYTGAKESDRKTYETAAWINYGVGAACIGAGALLYFLGVSNGQTGGSVVTLLPTERGAMAAAKGAF